MSAHHKIMFHNKLKIKIMKKAIRIKSFLVVLGLVSAGFASCHKSDDNEQPNQIVKVEDVNGNYSGKVITTQGKTKNEINTTFTAKDKVINYVDLPVKEIVGTAVKDAKKAEEAIKKMGKIKYDLDFTAALTSTKTAVELTFAPKALDLKIPVDNKTIDVKAIISAKQKGVYTHNRTRNLKYELSVDKIIVSGTEEAKFEAIKYSFPLSIKK